MKRNIRLGWFAETEVENKVGQSGNEDGNGNNSDSRVCIIVVIAIPLIQDKSMYTTSYSGEGTYIEERSSKKPQFLRRHCSVVITIGGRVAGAVPGDRIVEPLHVVERREATLGADPGQVVLIVERARIFSPLSMSAKSASASRTQRRRPAGWELHMVSCCRHCDCQSSPVPSYRNPILVLKYVLEETSEQGERSENVRLGRPPAGKWRELVNRRRAKRNDLAASGTMQVDPGQSPQRVPVATTGDDIVVERVSNAGPAKATVYVRPRAAKVSIKLLWLNSLVVLAGIVLSIASVVRYQGARAMVDQKLLRALDRCSEQRRRVVRD
jgi:hypothetical protein